MTVPRFSYALALALAIAAGLALGWTPVINWLQQAPPPEPLTIAISDDISSGLIRVAANQGYFAAEGLAVTLQPHTTGRAALDAVMANQSDVATTTEIPVMFATMKGAKLSIIATIASTMHAEGIVIRRAPDDATPGALRGKTLGVPLGTSSHYMMNTILANAGIAPEEVSLKALKPEALAPALSAGEVDAIAVWEPWLHAASVAAGPGSLLIYPDKYLSFSLHLVTQRQFPQDHPLTLQKLLRALLRAQAWVKEDPQAARAFIAGYTKYDTAHILRVWANYDLRLTLAQALLNMLEDQAHWAIANKLVDAKEMPNFLDALYLDAMLAVQPAEVSVVR